MGYQYKNISRETEEACRQISQRIRSKREELGMSQEELAKRIGYSNRASINKIENDVSKLTTDKIEAIAKAFGVTPSWLMWGNEETDTSKEIDPTLATQDAELLTIFHQLSANDKKRLVEMAKLFLQQP